MTAGFETYTEDGKLQVSSEMMQYYLSGSGSVTLNDLYYYSVPEFGTTTKAGPGTYTMALGAANRPYMSPGDFMAFRCSESVVYTSYPTIEGELAAVDVLPATRATNSPVLYWYRFSPYSTMTPSGFGLQVFDAAGNLSFDALTRPMIAVGSYPLNSGGYNEQSITLPTGKTYAAMVMMPTTRFESSYQDLVLEAPFNAAETGIRIVNNVLYYKEVTRTTYLYNSDQSTTVGSVVVLDVTGI